MHYLDSEVERTVTALRKAVHQHFRSSAGYGDAWEINKGFQSWSTAIADVLAAGHWLAIQAAVDPRRIVIVGWSYGG